jgi:exonuclease SbcC
MRLDALTIRGFARFTEPVTLDVSTLPEGLVAVTGENGAGKTFLLEAAMAGLYREFASRGALTEYATSRDSYIEAAFSVEGRGRYRARVNVDGIRRVTDAVLELTPEDGGMPALLNDGKASTFDACVRQTFPSRDLMLASAFAAQNQAGNFIHRKPAQRRELFGELLGLAHLTTMGQTAKTIAGHIEQAKGRLAAMRDVVAQQASPEAFAALREGEREARERQATAQILRDETGRSITDLEQRLALMQDAVAAHAAATQRLATLRTEQATRQAERRQCETDLQRAQAAYQAETARLHQETTATLEDIDQRLAGNATLQAKAETIRGAVAAVARLDRELSDLRTAHGEAQARERAASTALHAAERELAALAPLEQRQARDTRDAGLLGTVPCGGEGVYADCQFLRDATTARDRLASYVELLEPKATLADAVGRHKVALDAAAAEVRALAGRIRTAEGERATWADAAKYAEALAASDARVEELKARRAQVLEQAQRDQQAATDRYAGLLGDIAGRNDALDGKLGDIADAIEAAEADLAAVTDRHRAAASLQAQLTQARATWDGLTASLADIAATLREGMRRANVLTAQRRQADDLSARIATLDTELLEWQLLAKALGKDGLPDLEIDAAGPTISALTNELLEVCHGTRFSLELVTQVAKADGKGMRQDVTVVVTDNQSGGTARDIADLSGGEQVIVSEALRNAISLWANQRSTMPMRTCWRDETTGALDPENAHRYLAMLRKVQQMGGFAHVLFISHNPEITSQADAVVRVADGSIAVSLQGAA